MNDPKIEVALARIEALVRYQAVAQICTLSTKDCAEILQLAGELRARTAPDRYVTPSVVSL